MGCRVGPCSWSQECSSCHSGRGEAALGWGTEARLAMRLASRTGNRLTGHELVGLVPFLLVVMQCPQVDDNICALVNSKLADAVPERERRRGLAHRPPPPAQPPASTVLHPKGQGPFTPLCPLPHLSSAFARLSMNPALSSPVLSP